MRRLTFHKMRELSILLTKSVRNVEASVFYLARKLLSKRRRRQRESVLDEFAEDVGGGLLAQD